MQSLLLLSNFCNPLANSTIAQQILLFPCKFYYNPANSVIPSQILLQPSKFCYSLANSSVQLNKSGGKLICYTYKRLACACKRLQNTTRWWRCFIWFLIKIEVSSLANLTLRINQSVNHLINNLLISKNAKL